MALYALETDYSPTVSILILDSLAPSPISGLVIRPNPLGGELLLSWTNPTEQDLVSVEIHRSTGSAPLNPLPETLVLSDLVSEYSDTSVVDGTTYFYSIFCKDTAGNYSEPISGQATPNTTFQSPTIDLLLSQASSIYLSWQPVPYVDGYRIYCGTEPSPSSYANAIELLVTELVDSQAPEATIVGLINGTTYYVEISAYFATNETEKTAAMVTVGLLPPSNVVGTYNQTTGQIHLEWTKSESLTVDKYYIYYKTNYSDALYDGNGLTRDSLPANSPVAITVESLSTPEIPSIDFDNAIRGTPYWFKVVAADAANNTSTAAHGISNVTPPTEIGSGGAFPSPKNVDTKINQGGRQITIMWDVI